MGGTILMDMDSRPLGSPPTSSSGMVEVNMGEEYIGDILDPVSKGTDPGGKGIEGGTGSSFNEEATIGVRNQVGTNCAAPASEIQVDGMNDWISH